MVYVKHFDILGIDTAQIPCIELQGAPNTATVGAVGLLGMDVTSDGHEIYVCTAVNGAVYTWQCLKDGKDGVGVIKSEINANGELILTLSNGNTLNAGVVKGEPGEDGSDGRDGVDGVDGIGVTNVQIVAGELVITLSDGTEKNLGKVVGDDGQAGVGIVGVEVTANVELVVTLSNGTIMNLGSIKADHTVEADRATSTASGVNIDEALSAASEEVREHGLKIQALENAMADLPSEEWVLTDENDSVITKQVYAETTDIKVSGTWQMNSGTRPSALAKENVTFTCGGVTYTAIEVAVTTEGLVTTVYYYDENDECISVGSGVQWLEEYRNNTFDNASVSTTFYAWLTTHAVKQ